MRRGSNFKDLTNQTFGYLTVLCIDDIKSSPKHIYWLCQCECGKQRSLQTSQLTCKKVTSCGCHNPRTILGNAIKPNKRLFSIYTSMLARCNNPKNTSYKYYGGKGIKVCSEWENDFNAFASWSHEHNYNDTLSIDRIDNLKGYEPSNCRWVTLKDQSKNKSTSIAYTHNGETHNMKEWCEILKFSYVVAKSRRREAKRHCVEPTFEYIFAPRKFYKKR